MWSVTPFLINFPFDSTFGVCVEFFPHSPPKDCLLLLQGLVPPPLREIALSSIRTNSSVLGNPSLKALQGALLGHPSRKPPWPGPKAFVCPTSNSL